MYFTLRSYTIILASIGILFFSGFSSASAAVTMPQFSLPSVTDGKVVHSADFKGQVILVTFFATWCPPCRQEIPNLIALYNEYKSRGFTVIGLSVDEGGPSIVAKLVRQEKITYPVLMADRATARSFGGIAGIPTSFLVNRKGHVVKKYPGFVPHSLLVRDLEAVL